MGSVPAIKLNQLAPPSHILPGAPAGIPFEMQKTGIGEPDIGKFQAACFRDDILLGQHNLPLHS